AAASAPLSFLVSGNTGCAVAAGVVRLQTESGQIVASQAPGQAGLVTFDSLALPPGTRTLAALFSGPGVCASSSVQFPVDDASISAANSSGNLHITVGCVASATPSDIASTAQPNGAFGQPLLQ